MRAILVACALVSLVAATPAAAVDRLVDDGLVPCLSGALPLHATISAAVAAAAPGETILVCAGTYSDNVVVGTNDLTVRGQGLVRVIAANGGDEVFELTAARVTLQNLDISGAFGNCAVRVRGSGHELRDLNVHGNQDGICVQEGAGHRIRTSVIENNSFSAIRLRDVGVDILNNTFKNTGATSVFLLGPCAGTQTISIDHNLFVEPSQTMFVSGCAPVFTNNTIRGNGPGASSGIIVQQGNGIVLTRNMIQKVGLGIGIFNTNGATISFNSISFTDVGLNISAGSTGVTATRNNVSRGNVIDCFWNGAGINVLTGNNCGTQFPPGAFD